MLREDGHDVFTPSDTVVGERVHLTAPQGTRTPAIVGPLEFADLRDVVLVGHGYGGPVITVAAGPVPERLGHLVWVNAEVPKTARQR